MNCLGWFPVVSRRNLQTALPLNLSKYGHCRCGAVFEDDGFGELCEQILLHGHLLWLVVLLCHVVLCCLLGRGAEFAPLLYGEMLEKVYLSEGFSSAHCAPHRKASTSISCVHLGLLYRSQSAAFCLICASRVIVEIVY